jgi:hypothetical protein
MRILIEQQVEALARSELALRMLLRNLIRPTTKMNPGLQRMQPFCQYAQTSGLITIR